MYNVKKKYDNAIGPKQDINRKEIKKVWWGLRFENVTLHALLIANT